MGSWGIGRPGGLWNLCRKTLNVQVVPAQLFMCKSTYEATNMPKRAFRYGNDALFHGMLYTANIKINKDKII